MILESNTFDKIPHNPIEDQSLAGLPQLWESDKAITIFQKVFSDLSVTLNNVNPFYIRYKPETSCIIAYIAEFNKDNESSSFEIPFYAKVFTKSDFVIALDKAESHRWIKPDFFPAFISIPELDTILYFFPNDCLIDGLRILSGGKKIQRELYEYYTQYTVDDWSISDKRLRTTLVRYKPERRAVIKCKTKAVNLKSGIKERIKFYMRIYADSYGEKVFSIHNELYKKTRDNSILDIPKPMKYNRERNIFFMEKSPGSVLSNLIKKQSYDTKYVEQTAHALSELHQINLPTLESQNPDSLLNDVISTTAYLTRILPDLKTEIDDINQQFEKQKDNFTTNERGFVHGDCHPGQFLIDKNKVSVIDFDRSFTGDGLIDNGNFIAALRYTDIIKEININEKIQKVFIKKYEEFSKRKINSNLLSFWISYGLFKMAVKPFRDLTDNWPEKSSRIIRECLKLLT
jgi:tRNA A-37 threonylcarbamoyl transferase component Bud32